VGDAAFANRCIHKFEELKRKQVTVLFVSHDLGLVKRLSDRTILMLQGRVAADGSPNDVVNRYVGHVLERQTAAPRTESDGLKSSYRHGDGASRVSEVLLTGRDGNPITTIRCGEPVAVTVRARVQKRLSHPVVGILIRNRLGIDVFGTNTRLQQTDLGDFEPGQELEVTFRFDCLLTQQEYTLTVATQHWDGLSQDWLDDVVTFSVMDAAGAAGMVSLPTGIAWRKI
jgi:lipopolysaccharide transport system ATP-binding protein